MQVTNEPPAGEATRPPLVVPNGTVGLLDDFEGTAPLGTAGWEGFFQDNTDTRLTCAPESGDAHSGASSLKFEFDVAVNSWATCGFYFDNTQNWRPGQGISFYLRADRAGIPFDVDIYGGNPGGRTTYTYHMQTPSGSESDWTLIEMPWQNILRAEWEENPGSPFDPIAVTGFSIGLSTPETERVSGTIWLDDLFLLGIATPSTQPRAEEPTPVPQARNPILPCSGAWIIPIALVGFLLQRKSS